MTLHHADSLSADLAIFPLLASHMRLCVALCTMCTSSDALMLGGTSIGHMCTR